VDCVSPISPVKREESGGSRAVQQSRIVVGVEVPRSRSGTFELEDTERDFLPGSAL